MAYWLFKTEPSSFSYATLEQSPNQTAPWDGVRNFQARNYLRDEVTVGDQVFIYHSSIPEPAIVGIARVVKAGYPDHTAWDPTSNHFDPKSSSVSPTWYMVDVQAVRDLARPVTLKELKADPRFADCSLFTRPRLSIHPITKNEWEQILTLHEKTAR
jgi:predicted RNA-binding protein with PUA-like domain